MKKTMIYLGLGLAFALSAHAQTTTNSEKPVPPRVEDVINEQIKVTGNSIAQVKRDLEDVQQSDKIFAADYYKYVQPVLADAFSKALPQYEADYEKNIVPDLTLFMDHYRDVYTDPKLKPEQKKILLDGLLTDRPNVEQRLQAAHVELLKNLYSAAGANLFWYADSFDSYGQPYEYFNPLTSVKVSSHPSQYTYINTQSIFETYVYPIISEGCYSKTCLGLSASFRSLFVSGVQTNIDHPREYLLADGEQRITVRTTNLGVSDVNKEYGTERINAILLLADTQYPPQGKALPFDVKPKELSPIENATVNEKRRNLWIGDLKSILFSTEVMSQCPDSVLPLVARIKSIAPLSSDEINAIRNSANGIFIAATYLQYPKVTEKDIRKQIRRFDNDLEQFDRMTCIN